MADECKDEMGMMPTPESVADLMADLHEQLGAVRLHLNQLTAAHGPALTAVLAEELTDLELRVHGAERRLQVAQGALRRQLSDLECLRLDVDVARASEVRSLAALIDELEKRNRRSHAKPSPALARARKVLDQHNLDRGA